MPAPAAAPGAQARCSTAHLHRSPACAPASRLPRRNAAFSRGASSSNATRRTPPPPAAAAASSEAAAAFAELAAERLDTCACELRPCADAKGNGLFTVAAAGEGDVLLRVPLDACLAVDYSPSGGGLRLPAGAWPRLRKGLQKEGDLPWDLLQALATLDGLAGGGDAFWERYANVVLPQPLDLTLPLCFTPELLPELQHGAIEAGARAQQERLAGLFPGLSSAMCEGGPTWVQWAFACVRSRAFKLGDEVFASVPFLDAANHEADPACDFRLSADRASVELFTLRPLAAGAEATISYTGPGGQTSRRLMAQYGFVPRGGNPADRLQLCGSSSGDDSSSSSSSSSGDDSSSSSSSSSDNDSLPPAASTGPLLSLDRMQAALGDGERMAAALSGKDAFAYAALKSLPFAADESEAAPLSEQLALAERLSRQLEAEAAAWPTTFDADGALVAAQREAAAARGAAVDARLAAALDYRLQRKAVATSARLLLRDFAAAAAVQ